MARKPQNFQWIGFTPVQVKLLDLLDFVGNNAWSRNGQTETLMPSVLRECAEAGLSLEQIKQAMKDIGYSRDALHMLDRWESKRTTGRFGK
jgi:hypothetical protein